MTFAAEYRGALVVEAKNFGYQGIYADPVNRPRGIVIHTPEEPADDHMTTPYYFATTDREASTTYFVSYYGFIVQCVPENEGAYANSVTPDRSKPFWQDRPNLNLCTISVEVEGYAATIAQTISPAQRKALIDLLAYGCRRYAIPAERSHIIGHYEVASNRSDPGTLDLNTLVKDLKIALEDDMALTTNQEQALADMGSVAGWLLGRPTELGGQSRLGQFLAESSDTNNAVKALAPQEIKLTAEEIALLTKTISDIWALPSTGPLIKMNKTRDLLKAEFG